MTTTRAGGVSRGPYASLNLGLGCGDDPRAVAENRRRFASALPSEPGWMRQVHGACVVRREDFGEEEPEADAAWTANRGLACTVLTADCVPVLFCDLDGARVAAAHAGWRGLAAGVLEATVTEMDVDPGRLMAWLGPAISPLAYEVGPELREVFAASHPGSAAAFSHREGRWYADLYGMARSLLGSAGVKRVTGSGFCTFTDRDRFFSHRRDGATGRMASAIWLD